LTWRWCFYLNLIISAVALVPILYLWRNKFKPQTGDDRTPVRKVLAELDYAGIVAFAAAAVTLILALQFGGATYTWSDRRTIASLTTSGVLFIIFAAIQWWKGDDAILPGRVIGTRVMIISSIYSATLDGAFFILVYQIPLWFQAIHGLSARDSGYRMIPLLASDIFGSMTGTILTGKIRYYQPFMIFGAGILVIGSGLLTTLRINTSQIWILYQILAGAGSGFGSPLPLIAVQDSLSPSDVPIGYGAVLTAGYLSSSIALAIAQAVFATRLKHDIGKELPDIDPNIIAETGATDLRNLFPSSVYEQGLRLYNTALIQSWYISTALAGVSTLLVLGYRWKKMDLNDNK